MDQTQVELLQETENFLILSKLNNDYLHGFGDICKSFFSCNLCCLKTLQRSLFTHHSYDI